MSASAKDTEASQEELWASVAEYNAGSAASPAIVQEAAEADRLRWNGLLEQLAHIAKDNGLYEGETSDELVELLRSKLPLGVILLPRAPKQTTYQ